MSSRPTTADSADRDTRLPTLIEVLNRRTLPPVDLYSFYIYMRDQQRSVDYLDFWLDVSQHLSLCRHYVRELRRSVLLATPEMEKNASSKHSTQYPFDSFDLGEASGVARSVKSEKSLNTEEQRLSRYLRDEPSSRDSTGRPKAYDTNDSHNTGRSSPAARLESGNTVSSHSSDQDPSPRHTVDRADIRASAEKILYTFLLPGSEREIVLPQGILASVVEAIEEESRDDPEVFDEAKEYVFQAMERDAYPGFLRAKALGNLVPPSLMMRLIIGLLAMFGAFWTSFILIFLDYSRASRCWVRLSSIMTWAKLTVLRSSCHSPSESMLLPHISTHLIRFWHS
jgi:hypothetical protein